MILATFAADARGSLGGLEVRRARREIVRDATQLAQPRAFCVGASTHRYSVATGAALPLAVTAAMRSR
jgi:hypothetical protein